MVHTRMIGEDVRIMSFINVLDYYLKTYISVTWDYQFFIANCSFGEKINLFIAQDFSKHTVMINKNDV